MGTSRVMINSFPESLTCTNISIGFYVDDLYAEDIPAQLQHTHSHVWTRQLLYLLCFWVFRLQSATGTKSCAMHVTLGIISKAKK